MAHALFRAHLPRGPEIGGAADGVEPDEAHALVIEAPGAGAEHLHPQRPHVQIPVVLAGDEHLLDLDLLQQLRPQLQLHRVAQLREITPEDQEVGRRIHRLHFLERSRGLLHEARVDVLRIQMGVGHPGELERLGIGSSERKIDGVEEREPAEARRPGRPVHERLVQEGAPGDAHRLIGVLGTGSLVSFVSDPFGHLRSPPLRNLSPKHRGTTPAAPLLLLLQFDRKLHRLLGLDRDRRLGLAGVILDGDQGVLARGHIGQAEAAVLRRSPRNTGCRPHTPRPASSRGSRIRCAPAPACPNSW